MKRHTTLFGLLRELVCGDPQQKQKERVEKAVKAQAQLNSDAEFHRTMTDFYTLQVDNIDPHTDWWEFADAKQKEHDHVEQYQKYAASREEAAALVAAEHARYVRLQHGYTDTSEGDPL